MRETLTKVIERDVKLGEMEDKAEALADNAGRFQQTGGRLRRKMWWKKTKWSALIGTILLLTLTVIVLVAVL